MKFKDHSNWNKNRLWELIIKERKAQKEKWGQQEKSLSSWTNILLEETLEFVQAVNDYSDKKGSFMNIIVELVQVITVGLNILDMLLRGVK